MKKIWHDIKEIPEIPNGECQVRIALFERRPVELNTDLTYTIIESERIYREQAYNEKKWELFVMEHYLEKWSYWNELVSDETYYGDPSGKWEFLPGIRNVGDGYFEVTK